MLKVSDQTSNCKNKLVCITFLSNQTYIFHLEDNTADKIIMKTMGLHGLF